MSLVKWSIFLLLALSPFKGFCLEESKEDRPPILSTSGIIERYNSEGEFKGIILIERDAEPLKMTLPGGRVLYAESLEQTIRREIEDQLNVNLFALRQFHVYSEPSRDPRWHIVTVAQIAKTYKEPREGKGIASISVVSLEKIPWNSLSLDDAQILKDYLTYKEGNTTITMIKP